MSQTASHGKGKSLLQKVQYKTREELEKENPSLQAYGLKSGLHLDAIKKLQSLGARLIQVIHTTHTERTNERRKEGRKEAL